MGKRWVAVLRLVGMGWYIAICIVLGFFGGRWLGRLLDSEVFFILLGVGLGVLIAFLGVYRMVLPVMEINACSRSASTSRSHTTL